MMSTGIGWTKQAAEPQTEERSWKHKCFEDKLQHLELPSQPGYPWHYLIAFTSCCEKPNKQETAECVDEEAAMCRHGDHYSSGEKTRIFPDVALKRTVWVRKEVTRTHEAALARAKKCQ